jgi:hypothetical protein
VASRSATEAAQTSFEHEWLSSVEALYSFAAAHREQVRVNDAKLVFANGDVRSRFAKLLDTSKILHRRLLEEVQAGVDQQKHARTEAGVK